jgi:hypothetical protein
VAEPDGNQLPEAAEVYWRERPDERTLRRDGRLWTLTTVAHTLPFLVVGGGLLWLEPLTFPVAAMSGAHAWIIPELYAQRGANTVRPRPSSANEEAERRSLGMLGDLLGHEARELHARTGLVLERGELGVWLVGEAGALLLPGKGRRVHCFCVRVVDGSLPTADRIAHLLLALRADERGFATVANLAFSGARWRVRRRLDKRQRPALTAAARVARAARRRPEGRPVPLKA